MNVITISGSINKVTAQKVIDSLAKMLNENNLDPINILLNSTGGDVYLGFALYDLLKSMPNKVIVTAVGPVMSMATVVLLSGDERRALPNARFMVHLPSIDGEGLNPQHLKDETRELEILSNCMLEIYNKETNKNKRWWSKLLGKNKDHYLSAKEAKELNLIHKIVKKVV